jgi:hypothetical protein
LESIKDEKTDYFRYKSKILVGTLWIVSLLLAGFGAYLAGQSAEARFETVTATSSPEQKLEAQGRYDEAVQTVLDRVRQGYPEGLANIEVALIYINRAQKDRPSREKWAQQAVPYLDKAAVSAAKDPLDLETLMDDFDTIRDYSENGCPHYAKAIQYGQAALTLVQGNSFTEEGNSRSYPTQPIRQDTETMRKRIQAKVEACCREH